MKLSFFSFLKSYKKSGTFPPQSKPISQMIEPLKTDFKSAKEMFSYAKNRCIESLISDNPCESAVLVDIKRNKVLAEFKGAERGINVCEIKDMKLDKDNTVLMHGHPNSRPISSVDVSTLLNNPISQVIAFDKKGQFSLVAKKTEMKSNVSKEFVKYRMEQYDLAEDFSHSKDSDLYNYGTDQILKKYTPLMGLRYVSNYDYLFM